MPLPDPSLEPAVRDPKKLRNTALVLVAIMVLGGWLVLRAYDRWSVQQAPDERPAMIYRITPERDLRMLRQDDQEADLVHLRGKVVALNVTSLRDPAASELSLEVMKRLAKGRAANPDFRLITLVIDPMSREELPKALTQIATTHGIDISQWWVGSNEPATLHKFIKNELKAEVYPNEADGKWLYDSSIVLIDQEGHIRRAVVPQQKGGPPYVATFNFEQAAAWDAQGAKTGTERTNVEELESLLNKTIDKLLAEPAEKR